MIESRPTPRAGMTATQPQFPNVLKAIILDDILDSYDEDTVYIRHNSRYLNEFTDSLGMKLLFSFKPWSTMNDCDTTKYIYKINNYDDFMFVDQDSIIHDPSKVLDIEGKKYLDFRNELLEFAKEHDIRK